ncbi:autotransporter [Bradyrhizobium sp.]|uniref:autotransporter family protein n=1 Tax=Bradyrhizobium sp. TaxID=376 RepID=UPI0007C18857|nr:autotransporter outer membrane beta-barrel domain-containing protein [Bradyrhizobium sp.]CUT11116.1 autotransporter [Bradyrhizobium sp.]
MIAPATLALLASGALVERATAQACTVVGSTVTLTSGSCSIAPDTILNGAPAVHALTSANITTNNVNINPFNGGSTGGLAESNSTIIFSSGSSINGNWSIAASAQSGGQIIFQTGSAINPPFGGGSTALLANGANSQISAAGLAVGLNGAGGNVAARATNGGTIKLITGNSISYAAGGGGNTGFWATGAGSQLSSRGTTLSMPGGGGGDTGVRVDAGGVVTLNLDTVAVLGNGGGETGLLATGGGSTIAANTVAVNVSGGGGNVGLSATNNAGIITVGGSVSVVNGAGGLLQNGGTVTMAGTTVTASGNGGIGFLFNNGGAANTLQYSNATITASDASFSVQGATANINLSNTIATANNNTLLNTNSSGNTTFNAQRSTLQGVISTQNGGASTANLSQNTIWTMTGASTATTVINDESQIIYTAPTGDPMQLSSYKTLTAGNYTGVNGTVGLNTFLGADGSPSDRLIINGGSATGNSFLRITNAGGPGAETVANGIAVVQAINGGTTATGAFTLAGEVRGGAFDYFLFRGGLDGSSPNDWFLRSTFIVPPEPIEPPTVPLVPIGPSLPIDPPPGVLPPGVYPIIGPEIATYGVVQPIARQLGMTTLGTLHERTGDTSLAAITGTPCLTDGNTASGMPRKAPVKAPTDCRSAGWASSVWGRVLGQQIDNHYRAFADPRASGQLLGFQSGIDLWRGEWMPGHRDAAGIYGGYANANVNVSGLVTNEAATGYVLRHTGGLNLNAWSGGAYWTHYGPNDWYLDAVAQATRYEGAVSTQFASLSTTGFGFLSSLETGYPIRLAVFGPGFVLEPQAQVVWQYVSFDDANDGFGAVALGTTSGASGRIGLRGKWSIVSDSGELWQPYLRANLWRDWGARATAVYSGVDPVPLLEQATRLQLGGGVSVRMSPRVSIYANADYQFAVGNTDGGQRDGIRGAAGVRYTW